MWTGWWTAKECPKIKAVTVTSITNPVSLQSCGRLFAPSCLPALMKWHRPQACKAQLASSVLKSVIAIQALKSRFGRPSRSNLTVAVRFVRKTFISLSNKVCFNKINNHKMISSTLDQILRSNPLFPNTLTQNRLPSKALTQRCSPRRHQRRRACSQTYAASCKNSCRSKNSKLQEPYKDKQLWQQTAVTTSHSAN